MEINTLRQETIIDNNINQGTFDIQVKLDKISNTSTSNGYGSANCSSDRKYTEKDLQESLDIVNVLLSKHNSHAEYYMHEKFKNVIMIKFVDSDTGKTIQEVPPKKIMDMVAKMCEMVGILVDKKA